MNGSHLHFIITGNKAPLSLSHLDSDRWGNLIIMEQVVGTLVKYTQTGRYQPFLVDRWETSLDEKVWTFIFRENLTAENGEPINAQTFAQSFTRVLKIYSKTYDPPTFKLLKGWDAFQRGDRQIQGVKAIDARIFQLTFNERPSGVLEFLSMPYFGYYSSEDFDSQDQWRNEHKITSSGAYRVLKATTESVELAAREGWPTLRPMAPQRVSVSNQSLEDALKKKESAVMISLKEDLDYVHQGFKQISSVPTLLNVFILSPFVPPFNDKKVRLAFRTVVRGLFPSISKYDQTGSFYFYPNSVPVEFQQMDFEEALRILKDLNPQKIKVFRQAIASQGDATTLDLLLTEVSKKIGWLLKIETPDTAGPKWQDKVYSNKYYPLRVTRVDVGGNPENWVVEMMFCSTLGVSFPDSEGGICQLVRDYSHSQIKSAEDYGRRLHQSIENEASVIPIKHSGFTWLISEKIHLDDFSPTMNLPRFDLLEIRK